MRLDKLLANAGLGSRKDVKALLKKGCVTVNGEIIKNGTMHVDENADIIKVNETAIHYQKYVYIMMHKPPGVISATEDKREKTVIDLLPSDIKRFRPFPVGRLDKDTEGLLLITNNGELAHQLLSPKKQVDKTYYAKVKGLVTEEDCNYFARGVRLNDGYITKPALLRIIQQGDVSEVEIVISEGKFHQVKRMFLAVDKKVIYLKRTKMGKLSLDSQLNLGEYRELSKDELELLTKS
ncbi:pseudouridine synthase [Virgibacillus proomii]|uniref:pseudouridine synthase n=1 Tax=Virgibacillus proomii TaxID=84407 RepID=UPI001C103F6E|nr:pseudouridine synthase [Virgibacillus proomii]MBU5265517.1 rRNA pseudouridine synthase [Virgibacillus proomii]